MYTLVGRIAVPCFDYRAWAVWFATADRVVRQTKVGPLLISTVFLGLDHNWTGGDPQLFETMIFDGADKGTVEARTHTWGEAEQAHEAAVDKILAAISF